MAKRDFKSPLDAIPVEIGNTTVLVTAVSSDQVRIRTQPDGMNVRGVMVTCDEGFTLDAGQWTPWSEKSRFNTTVRRAGTYEDATPTMRRAVLSTFRQAAEAFAQANPTLLVEAGLVAVNNDVHRLDNDIEKAEKVLNDLLDKRVAALAEERGLEEMLPEVTHSPRM